MRRVKPARRGFLYDNASLVQTTNDTIRDVFDFDQDTDVDLADLARFQEVFGGW